MASGASLISGSVSSIEMTRSPQTVALATRLVRPASLRTGLYMPLKYAVKTRRSPGVSDPARTFFTPSHKTAQVPAATSISMNRLRFAARRVVLSPALRLDLFWREKRSPSYYSRVKA